ncbi:MAG TPA: aminotransferase class I/II-fold pyridoxal phosphate-dependent enzyme [Caulobacteraceae bacterium]|nr:aminotransferase class I/II-fold pyridoxal phosphate-dependent enzyme [Caulobacteraceae bacterium]
MKASVGDLALFGGVPEFATPLHVGQLNLPPFEDFEASFRDIFRRRFFTNHGPLVRTLDERLARRLGVRHAICVANGTVALMVACAALDLRDEVIVPAFTFPATVQALSWAGLTAVFCDVDPYAQTITAELVEPLITERTSAVLGVHLWGRACDPDRLLDLCRRYDLKLLFDAAHAIDCTFGGRLVGGFGDLEVFSFHATKILGSAEGGALTTNDDELAARIRTARNFHGAETFAEVALRINGKMSEAQAAMGLLALDHLDEWGARNRELYHRHQQRAGSLSGVSFLDHAGAERSNYQYCVIGLDAALDLSRDELRQILEAEGIHARRYFFPGMHRTPPYGDMSADPDRPLPVTDRLCALTLQLPLGSGMDTRQVNRIWEVIEFCLGHGRDVRRALDSARQGNRPARPLTATS